MRERTLWMSQQSHLLICYVKVSIRHKVCEIPPWNARRIPEQTGHQCTFQCKHLPDTGTQMDCDREQQVGSSQELPSPFRSSQVLPKVTVMRRKVTAKALCAPFAQLNGFSLLTPPSTQHGVPETGFPEGPTAIFPLLS